MSRDALPDYEQMYCLLSRRRGQELALLHKIGDILSELYVRLVQRDAMFSPDMVSWDRGMLADSMVHVSALMDSYTAAEAKLEHCATTPANAAVGMEVIHGKKHARTAHRSRQDLDNMHMCTAPDPVI